MRRRLTGWCAGWAVLSAAAGASAAPHEVRVPLRDGRLAMADLIAGVRLPAPVAARLPGGTVDLRGFGSSLFVAALDRALGDGCRVEVTPDALVVHVDGEKLPQGVDGVKQATRTFTAVAAPDATAAQARRYGLALPKAVDPARPLVVMVHGINMTPADMADLGHRLAAAGYQTADFDYPPDGPIADDVALFARHLSAVHEAFPDLTVDVVAFSMGGLVARGYVEADAYPGGVDRLILIATPNHGSTWAGLTVLTKGRLAAEQVDTDPAWRPTWLVTGGLCEAGRDLTPGSPFLTALNAHGRRAGVRYTIVDGDQGPAGRVAAGLVAVPRGWVPKAARSWWGVRQAEAGLAREAARLAGGAGPGDGPVSLASAALDGVSDVVTVHADHATIYRPDGDRPPPAWATVRDRLAAR